MTRTGILPAVEIEPGIETKASVIWLHGLGADGHDFEPIVPHLGLDPALGIRFIFPHAPAIPVTLNMGMVMPAWYDITAVDLRREVDQAGVERSADHLRALIARENERGIPCEQIVVAGFSQGGAVALFTGLRHPERLAGFLALSTYLVGADTLEAEASAANRSTQVFQAHGINDPMVPLARAVDCRDRLQALGYSLQWHTYPMQHEVCLEEIQAVGAWLSSCFQSSA